MIDKAHPPRLKTWLAAALLCACLPGAANAGNDPSGTATEGLVDQLVALTEQGDPASLEKMNAAYLVDAAKRFNPAATSDTWKTVRAEVDEMISRKTRAGYGEQALLTRHFIERAHFSDDELRRLIAMQQDPLTRRWGAVMHDSETTHYMAMLSQQVNNQLWFMVSIVLRRHGLQTSEGAPLKPAAAP
ncbi:MAG: hypothetical protein VB138_15295 [Burkholderia sp.]